MTKFYEDSVINKFKDKPKIGYEEGPITTFECTGCGCPLLQVMSILDIDVDTRIQVHCPYCGDHSDILTVHGKFIFMDDPEVNYCAVSHTDYINDVLHVYMGKGTKQYKIK